MKKTTFKFNKLLKVTLFSFAIGAGFIANAQAQCPANITINSAAGTCGAVVNYVPPIGSTGQSANGIVNGNANGMTGWNVLLNGGSGWAAENNNFVTSYGMCTKWQLVTLSTLGVTDAYMDTSPTITVSEDYRSTGTMNDTYLFTVELRGASGNVLASYTTGNITSTFAVQTVSRTFTGYPAGVRRVYVLHGGRDAESWFGPYGAAMNNTQVKVAVSASTVVQTAGLASGSVFPAGTTTNTFQITTGSVVSTCSFDVIVNDTQAPVAIARDITVALNGTGIATITPAQINNNSTDNCSIETYALDVTAFTCEDIGENTVTLTVTDENGNTDTATAVVTVEDTTAPTVTTQNVRVQLNAAGTATVTAEQVVDTASDSCGTLTHTLNTTAFTCDNLGGNPVIVTSTDSNGNIVTSSAVVTVEDNIVPNVLTQNYTVALNANLEAVVAASSIDNGSTDNCEIISYVLNPSTFNCENIGENTVTLSVVDAAGNVGTAAAIVTITDPENLCPVAGISDKTLQAAIKVYPNPTSGSFTITAENAIEKAELYDVSGRLLSMLDIKGTGDFETNISSLNTGIYFVKLYGATGSTIKQIIKK